MEREERFTTDHLSDGELFALALPPTGAPEPLPRHFSECLRCSRALADWKIAVRELADEDEQVVAGRSPEEWRAVEDATLSMIRRAGAPGRGGAGMLRWALPVAASLLLFGLLVGRRDDAAVPIAPVDVVDDPVGLSVEDRADDVFLRDVERLASGEEAAWGELAPDPAGTDPAAATEDRS
jgi:hypothetical protein